MNWLDIAVVGGINLDVIGQPAGPFKPRDSLIGSVRFSCGGVGHNIAAQAVRTGANVSFYSVFGDDHNAEWLRQACLSEGLRIDHSIKVTGASSVYMAVHDTDGDMLCAVNDMRLMDGFTPDILAPMLPSINRADVCVIDANLPVESLLYLAERAAIPLVCDPVSAEKAQRIIPLMKHLSALKPNLMEAQSMTGATTPEACGRALLDMGAKNVFISLGKDGLYYADDSESGYLRPKTLTSVPMNGAGDAMTAGIASGIGLRYGVLETAKLGMETVSRYLHLA